MDNIQLFLILVSYIYLIHTLLNVPTFIIEEFVFRIITLGVGGDDL